MAGDMRIGGTTTGKTRKSRKLWSLQDRSVMSIHLLKATLAEDGCEEAQLDVAKKLLNGDSDDIPTEAVQNENARLAIYWLIKSSEQGNEEATKLLGECFESGLGVTCQNILDVKACIKTPINEKLAFKAAKLLFERLNNGEDFITTTQLLARLEARKFDPKVTFEPTSPQPQPQNVNIAYQGQSKLSTPPASATSDSPPNTDFSPNRTFIIESPVKDAPGSSPTSEDDSFTHIETQCLKSYRNLEGVKLTALELMKVAAVFNQGQLPPAPINPKTKVESQQKWNFVSVWNAFTLQLIITSMAFGFISHLFGLLLCSTFLCVWSAYNFVIWKKRKSTFEDWTEIFRSVLQQKIWNDTEPAAKFSKKYLRPYLLTNLSCLVFFSLVGDDPSLKIFSAILSLFGMMRAKIMSPVHSWQLVAIVGIQLISNYVSSSEDQLNILRSFDVDFTILVHSWIPIFVYDFIPTDFAAVFLYLQLILIVHYITCTQRKIFSPANSAELMGGFWLLKIIQWSADYNSYEEYAIVFGAVLCVVVAFICVEHNIPLWKILTSLGLAFAVVLLSYYGYGPKAVGKFITGIEANDPLEWKEYERNCHLSAWRTQTMAETQMNCVPKYENSRVVWKGKISLVNLHNHDKRPWDSKMVNLVFEVLVNAAPEESTTSMEMANLWKWQNYIPLNGYHSYQEHVAPVSLQISTYGLNDFDRSSITRHIFNLRTGDIIEFSGTLTKNLGSLKPEVGDVESLKCIKCSTAESGLVVLKRNNFYSVVTGHLQKSFQDFQEYIQSLQPEAEEHEQK